MDKLLEHFDKEEVKKGREEKEEKKNEKEVLVERRKRSFAEEFLGLTKNPRYEEPIKKRRKLNSQKSKVEERVTYVDLSHCTIAEEDELPDIPSDEFPGAQANENDCITPLFTANLNVGKEDEFTGTLFTGAQDIAGAPFTGAYEVTGAQDVAGTQFTGAPFQINEDFTGVQEKDVPMRVQEARRRLSLSLKKSKVPENFSQPNTLKKSSDIEFVDSIC